MSIKSLQRNDYEYHITCPQNYDFFRSFIIMLECFFFFLAIKYEKFSYQSVSNNNQGGTLDLKFCCLPIYTPRLQRIGQGAPK